jgi:hypothetical protein
LLCTEAQLFVRSKPVTNGLMKARPCSCIGMQRAPFAA